MVESGGLENRCARKGTEGSNPSPSASAPGVWTWSGRHPDWHPGGFGDVVTSYALQTDGALLLVDPLVGDDEDHAALDALAAGRDVHVLVTIGYHVRSAEDLAQRYDGRIWGPATCAGRLRDATLLTSLEPGEEGPEGIRVLAIGRPARTERPIWMPSHAAVAFGDALVTTPEGDLRMWIQERPDARKLRFYRERFAPTLAPIAELEPQHVLVTHGAPVLGDGARALREALDAAPWYHRG